MAITVTPEADLFSALIALYQAQYTDKDMGEHSYLGKQSRAEAQALSLLMRAVQLADYDSVPAFKQDSDGTTISRCSSDALDMWALTYGLPTDTSGVFGRRGARGSSGGVGTPACTIGGTLIAANSTATDPTGQITVQTVANVTTDGPPNTLPVTFESVTTGLAANLPKNTILTWTAPPAGVAATVTLTTGLSSGRDRESDGELLARLLFRIQNPPRGGTAADYRYWAENSTDSTQNNKSNNIFRAHVYPMRSGAGSVDVMPLLNSSGTGRDPGATVVAAVLAYLNTVRPVTVTVNVIRPSMLAARALRIRVKLTPKSGYKFDWADAATSTIITAINQGAKTLTTAGLPAALTAAIDAGSKPRIQVVVSTAGASPKPTQVRCLSHAAGVITLESWPFTVNPTAGVDIFWAGGPVVDLCATACLSLVDSIGPSRQSGFADENDPWDWKLSISAIVDVVMDVRDTDGTRIVDSIPSSGGGTFIGVGAAIPTDNDHTPLDVINCELPYLAAGGIEIITAT